MPFTKGLVLGNRFSGLTCQCFKDLGFCTSLKTSGNSGLKAIYQDQDFFSCFYVGCQPPIGEACEASACYLFIYSQFQDHTQSAQGFLLALLILIGFGRPYAFQFSHLQGRYPKCCTTSLATSYPCYLKLSEFALEVKFHTLERLVSWSVGVF